ncbi:MAG: AAA family ATPase [Candidatus Odinarchaeota archaeon]|nr:AAA family ATPase [Candidatus Odinarchaeota archaeon]
MIEKIIISNYKSIRELELNLSKINVLIGPNNSGKTSILEGISSIGILFSNEYDCCDESLKISLPRMGDVEFNKIVHRFDKRRLIELGIVLRDTHKNRVSKIIGISPSKGTLKICYKDMCLLAECRQEGGEFTNKYIIKSSIGFSDERIDTIFTGTRNLITTGLPKEIASANEIINAVDRKIFFIPAERGTHELAHPVPEDLPTPEKSTIADAFNILYFIRYKTAFKDTIQIINSFLKPYNLEDVRTIPVPGKKYEVVVRDVLLNEDINIAQIGFGLNQLIPMLILLSYYPNGSLILLEQPGLHLHPRLQADFANLIEYIIKNKEHQLVIETHSEHILFNLLNLVAKKRIHKKDIKVYYVYKEDAETKIRALEITDYGTVVGGIPGFFETDFDTFMDWMKAVSERQSL